MEEEDDYVSWSCVNCNCRCFEYNPSGVFCVKHDATCPFLSCTNTAIAASNVQLRRLISLQTVNAQNPHFFDPCPDDIPMEIDQDLMVGAFARFERYQRELQSKLSIGYGRSLLTFKLIDSKVKKALRGGVHFRISRLNVIQSSSHKVKEDTKLKDVLASFGIVFENIVEEVRKEAKDGDKIQFIVYTKKSPAFDGDSGMTNPVSTKIVNIENLTKNIILPFIIKSFKNYEHILIGDELIVESVLIRSGHGMSRAAQDALMHGNDPLSDFKRKGIIKIGNFDNMCLTRAVSVCLFYKDCLQFPKKSSEYKNAVDVFQAVRHDEKTRHYFQRQAAETLCVLTGVGIDEATNDTDIQNIAETLHLCIKIVSNEGFGIARTFGDKTHTCIYLLERKVKTCRDKTSPDFVSKYKFHLDAIIDMRVVKKRRYYCTFCDVGSNYVESHRCPDISVDGWCFACYDRACSNFDSQNCASTKCSKCGVVCKTLACAERHKALKICGTYFCSKCSRRLKKKEITPGVFQTTFEALALHSCWITCHLCGREKRENEIHKCFMLRQPFRPVSSKLLFLDFETDQSSGTHVPIFCAMEWVEIDEDDNETIVHQGSKTFGLDYGVADDVGAFLFQTPAFKEYSIVAHNMRGFDGCFLLKYLIEHNFQVDLICNGLKLTSVFIPGLDIRLIDSLNFFQMSLSGIVSAMGLEATVKSKGYFPHFFAAPDKLNYVGPLPDPEMFGCHDMKSKQYGEFMAWYNENKHISFNFAESMKMYCCQDVTILKEGVLKFRKTVIDMIAKIDVQKNTLSDEQEAVGLRAQKRAAGNFDLTVDDPNEGEIDCDRKTDVFDVKGVCDPFSYLTAPGMCSAIFKARFLKRNSIAQLLPAGYENYRHSQTALEYLEYLRQTKYPTLLHAQNTYDGKEVRIKQWRVDGFVPDKNIVVEFHGCFWHGCPECISNPFDVHPVRKLTFDCLLQNTLRREDALKLEGYEVETMWECRWDAMKKEAFVKNVTDGIFIKSRLSPRDAFRGGRVEAGKLIYDVRNSKYKRGLAYVDICSLYPTVNCYDPYPVAHPIMITSGFDCSNINQYFGLIQCSVLPPQHLRNGVLPVHANNKLLFPLCRTCAENMQIDPCEHSECDRMLHGVWVSEELKQAVKHGYKISQIYCVHHFPRKSKELFSSYIKTFFKMKLAASKRPAGETSEELHRFIEDLKVRDGIEIKPDEFQENAGIRNIAKLCCNSFWGRLGMRDAFPKVALARTSEELAVLFADSTKEVTDVRYISDDCVCALIQNKSLDTLNFSNNTNIYLAVFTTAYARMRLYDLIEKVGDRFVYCDTDSVIYELSSDACENLPTGQFMGDLTSELDEGEVIEQFVSGGPKVYAFVTNQNRVVVKIKGFQLNERTKTAFSFDNLKRVIQTYISTHLDSNIGRVRFDSSVKEKHCLRQTIFDEHHAVDETSSSVVAVANAISVFDVNRILRSKSWDIFRGAEQKIFTYSFNKRIVCKDASAVPFGFV